jgi:hypothetical protein
MQKVAAYPLAIAYKAVAFSGYRIGWPPYYLFVCTMLGLVLDLRLRYTTMV